MKSLTDYILESKEIIDKIDSSSLDSDGKEQGFEYVDLGFKSGTKWATCNVGSKSPKDPGLLFQFGRVDGYKYKDNNNKFYTGKQNKSETGSIDFNKTTSGTIYKKGDILKLEDDAAHVNMGGKWRMPTKVDLQELYDNTTKRIVKVDGKKGILLTSEINGKSIFGVFGGYWTYGHMHIKSRKYTNNPKWTENGWDFGDDDYNDDEIMYYEPRFDEIGHDGSFRSSQVINEPGLGADEAWILHFYDNDNLCYLDPGFARAYAFNVRGVFK